MDSMVMSESVSITLNYFEKNEIWHIEFSKQFPLLRTRVNTCASITFIMKNLKLIAITAIAFFALSSLFSGIVIQPLSAFATDVKDNENKDFKKHHHHQQILDLAT